LPITISCMFLMLNRGGFLGVGEEKNASRY
jgi:hypothetical protein